MSKVLFERHMVLRTNLLLNRTRHSARTEIFMVLFPIYLVLHTNLLSNRTRYSSEIVTFLVLFLVCLVLRTINLTNNTRITKQLITASVLASDPKPRTFQTNRIQRKTKLRRNRYLILIWVIN